VLGGSALPGLLYLFYFFVRLRLLSVFVFGLLNLDLLDVGVLGEILSGFHLAFAGSLVVVLFRFCDGLAALGLGRLPRAKLILELKELEKIFRLDICPKFPRNNYVFLLSLKNHTS